MKMDKCFKLKEFHEFGTLIFNIKNMRLSIKHILNSRHFIRFFQINSMTTVVLIHY